MTTTVKVFLVPLFGSPGSGKGTIKGALKKFSINNPDILVINVETGSYFRKEAEKDSNIRQTIADGNLLPDFLADKTFQELFHETVANVLLGQQLKSTIIVLIDGYPRTMDQWETFLTYKQSKDLNVVPVFLELDERTVLKRAKIRRICPKCGTTFSIKEHKRCPNCQARGRRRPDDLIMPHRLEVFKERTMPVITEAHNKFLRYQITVDSSDLRAAALEIWTFFQTL